MDFPIFPDHEDPEETPFEMICEDCAFSPPDAARTLTWLQSIAKSENIPWKSLSVIFCSDEYLRNLNAQYLQHDYYTDIVTFPYANDAIHGDMFVSIDRVADNAQTLQQPFERELRRVLAHGVLHLCGYADATPDQKALMRAKEDYWIQQADAPDA